MIPDQKSKLLRKMTAIKIIKEAAGPNTDREDDQQLTGFSNFTTHEPDQGQTQIKCISCQ